ncbi:hypothetical protein D3C80_1350030 [compost metagenome]
MVGETGRGHQLHLRLAQAAGDQGRVFITQISHAQRDVDAFGNQVDAAVEQHHVQLHQRVLGKKAADYIRQEGMRQRHRARHPQAPARLAAHAGHGFIGGFGLQ